MDSILKKNQRIDNKFEVLFYLGEINNGQLYQCRDITGNLVRLKVYNAAKLKKYNFTDSGDLIESTILKLMNHKNIVRFIEEGDFSLGLDRYKYIATEFLSGESLTDRLKRENPLSPYAALPIILDILEAVKYLHAFDDPIIHNAIVLDNIILDYKSKSEKAILTNFQYARPFSYRINISELSELPVYYRASESFNNIITPRSDLFSVGALFYNLITGLPPWYQSSSYKIKTKDQLIEKIIEERANPLKFSPVFEDQVDDHIKMILIKALSDNIDERFHTAEEFIKALKREVNLGNGNVKNQVSISLHEKKRTTIKKHGKGFSAIAGMDNLKDILYNDVIKALNEPEKYAEFGITIPNGILLYGPPGCGKTFFAQKLAEEVGYNFIAINPSDLASPYVHGGQEKIGKLFNTARENAPTIIFFDEIDALIPNRTGEISHHYAAEVNEFLAQLSDCSEAGLFIIGATNRPDRVDPAVLRTGRLDKKIFIPPPDIKAREALFRIYLKDRPIDLDLDYELLSQKTEYYVSSDIKFIVDESSRKALRSESRISMKILLEILDYMKPSVKKSEILQYQELQRILNDDRDNDTKPKIKPFGFTISDDPQDKE